MSSDEVEIRLAFNVVDAQRLLALAEKAIAAHGTGHEFDPADLGGNILELLLHSNPAAPDYRDIGVELLSSRSRIIRLPS